MNLRLLPEKTREGKKNQSASNSKIWSNANFYLLKASFIVALLNHSIKCEKGNKRAIKSNFNAVIYHNYRNGMKTLILGRKGNGQRLGKGA